MTNAPSKATTRRSVRRGRWAVVVAVAAVVLVATAPAQATIVPSKSIANARIGMTEKQIRAALGAPQSVQGNASSKELATGQ